MNLNVTAPLKIVIHVKNSNYRKCQRVKEKVSEQYTQKIHKMISIILLKNTKLMK